ncbi:MAG: hypothetical protein EXS03_01005 [Phycisphaerales bacterium]|nr:hypothetical protein [Phycisphaerales bacterium]
MELRAILWLGCALAMVACQNPQVTPRPDGAAPTGADLATMQNKRIAALSTLALRGHAEVRWRDSDGSHFDDGDFDLIARPPSEVSFRISKLGERILWIGGGGGEWWTVFPKERPSRAILRPWNAAASVKDDDGVDGSLSTIVAPARLFEALGLVPIAETEVRAVVWDEVRGAWKFTLASRRLFVRGESLLPVGCEWLDELGEVIATCELDSFEWPTGTREAGARALEVHPLVPTRITVSAWTRGRGVRHGPPDAKVSLAAETPSFGADRIKPQLFRWTDVQAALRPEVIEDRSP